MKRGVGRLTVVCFVVVAGIVCMAVFGGLHAGSSPPASPGSEAKSGGRIQLPKPREKGGISVEEAIFGRKSTRRYKDAPLTMEEVSQLLWAAGGKTVDGITGATRAYASAGGLHPLEIYLVAGNVQGLASGVYRYDWKDHTLSTVKEGDVRKALSAAAYGQGMAEQAPASIVLTAVYPRTTSKYGERGESRYVPMDAGGAGQNVHLQAESLGLGTVMMGAFQDDAVRKALGIGDETPLYIMPVGRK
jgi:SagB-type dehydrogenase family enzyme